MQHKITETFRSSSLITVNKSTVSLNSGRIREHLLSCGEKMCLKIFPVHFYFPAGENSLGASLGVPSDIPAESALVLQCPWEGGGPILPCSHFFSIHYLAFPNQCLLWEKKKKMNTLPGDPAFLGHLAFSPIPHWATIFHTQNIQHTCTQVYKYTGLPLVAQW